MPHPILTSQLRLSFEYVRAGEETVVEARRASFTPLVQTVNGVLGREVQFFLVSHKPAVFSLGSTLCQGDAMDSYQDAICSISCNQSVSKEIPGQVKEWRRLRGWSMPTYIL